MSKALTATHDRASSDLHSSGDGAAQSEDDWQEVMSLLGDDVVQQILTIIDEEPSPARELAESLDVSRTTVYRRLNRLQETALVETSMSLHLDGNHRKKFHIAVDGIRLSLTDEGPRIGVTE